MKKIYSLLFVLLVAVMSVNAATVIASGDGWTIKKLTSGDFVPEERVGVRVMYISKSTAVKDYRSLSEVPWNNYRGQVDEVYMDDIFEGAQHVGSYCFTNMTNLKKARLWNNIYRTAEYTIGTYAFSGCPKLTDVTGVHKCTEIGYGAFKDCTKLNYITVVSEDLTSIGDHAFADCDALKGLYYYPSSGSRLTIGEKAFYGSGLTSFNGDVVTSVGKNAFSHCPLSSIELWKCTTIGESAFFNCKLSYVRLGSSMTSIGDGAFWQGLENNGTFCITAKTAPTLGSDVFRNNALSTITLQTATNATGYNVAPWNQFKEYELDAELYVVISGTTLTVYFDGKVYQRGGKVLYPEGTGTGFTLLPADKEPVTKVVFDASVNSARPTNTVNWFSSFPNLKTIENIQYLHTDEVTDMGRMFNYCPKLQSIDLSHFNTSNVTSMNSMFSSCSALTELDVNSFDMSNVEDAAFMFAGCTNLQRIYCNKDWRQIGGGWYMFNNCTSLIGGWGTPYDASKVDAQYYARPDGGSEAPGYFWRQGDTGQEPEPEIEPTDPEQPDLCEVFGIGSFEFVTCQVDDSQFGVNNMLSFVFYTEEGWYISDSGDLVKGSDNGSLLLLTIYPQSLTALSGMYPANDECRLMEISGSSQSVSKAVSGDIIISVNEEGTAYDFVYSLTMNNGTTISGVISGVCADEIDQEQAVENVQSGKVQSTKLIHDGQLLIERNGKTYNAIGAEVK